MVAKEHQGFRKRGAPSFAFLFSDAGSEDDRSSCVWTSWRSLTGSYNETDIFEAKELARRKTEEISKSIRATLSGAKDGVGDDEEMMI